MSGALTDDERERLGTWLRHHGVYSFALLCDIADSVDRILSDRFAAPFMCETHLCGLCGGCKAAKVRDRLSEALATEGVLRGEIRRSESALATFDDVVAQRDALTRALVKRNAKRLPTIPIGTRVRVRNMGVGTVIGADGVGFDGVAVIFDEPAPSGYEDGCCAGIEECEVLTIPPAVPKPERPGEATD